MNESQILARHIVDLRYDEIPDKTISVAKASLLDALGVMLAASTLGEGCRQFVDLALDEKSKPESTILGCGERASATMAAFANGALAHALDFEDAYDGAPVHPNATTIPAALAVAEALGNVRGKKFLTSIVLGSDLVCRLGLALRVNPLDYGWYIPPILGAFGATTAVSKLLALNADQIVDAFSLAMCQATCSAELTRSPRSTVRSIRDAFAAKAGVVSARLAQQGIVGFEQPIEGKAGLFNLYARGNYDAAKVIDGLGKNFENANVSFKPYPSCRGTHSYIDAVLQIQAEHDFALGDVKQINVVVNSVNKMLCEPIESKRHPVTAIDAKFSIPFVVATTLVHRHVTLDRFFPIALADPQVLELTQRVNYKVDSRLGATQGYLEIVTRADTFDMRIDIASGHPGKPMSQDALVQKFRQCAKYSARKISDETLDEIINMVLNLEHVDKIGELTEKL